MRSRFAIRQLLDTAAVRKGLTKPGSGCKLRKTCRRGGTADTGDLKSLVRKDVRVQIPPPAPASEEACSIPLSPKGISTVSAGIFLLSKPEPLCWVPVFVLRMRCAGAVSTLVPRRGNPNRVFPLPASRIRRIAGTAERFFVKWCTSSAKNVIIVTTAPRIRQNASAS